MWEGNAGSTLATNARGGIDNPRMNLPTNMKISEVPFQPWARALYAYRQSTTTKDDPHTKCLPSGGPRLFIRRTGSSSSTYLKRNASTWWKWAGPTPGELSIWTDGRIPRTWTHLLRPFGGPLGGRLAGGGHGGFQRAFWLTREGIPHTEYLHLIEHFTRTDYNTMKYEATIDDPGAYTKPWTGGWIIRWQPDMELYEYVCQDNNKDPKHMFGGER